MTNYREIENPTVEKVQAGDRVTFTTPQNTKMGEVCATAYRYSGTAQLFVAGYGLNTMSIRKIERPVPSLPEEEGLYTLASSNDLIAYARVFRLWGGSWEELAPSTYAPVTSSLKDKVESGQWTLTRLVKEDSNGQ